MTTELTKLDGPRPGTHVSMDQESPSQPAISPESPSSGFSSKKGFLARLGLLHVRTRFVALLYVMVLAMVMLQRLIVWRVHAAQFESIPSSELANAFLVGLRFDVVVAGMAVLPLFPILFLAMPRLIERRAFKAIVTTYGGAAITLLAVILAADYFFFEEFLERLDERVFTYTHGAGNEYVLQTVWAAFPVIPVLALCLATGLAGAWLLRRFGFNDDYNRGPVWQAVVWPALMAALVALGVRGTLRSHAINSGPAYFSPTALTAQLTLNGAFTLRQAAANYFLEPRSVDKLYRLLDPETASRILRDHVWQRYDRPVAEPVNVLHRRSETGRPRRDFNVVLVAMESIGAAAVGPLGGDERLMPNFNRLADEGLFFEQCYSVGHRTQRGIAGIVSSYPDLPNESVTTDDRTTNRFSTLARILNDRGYASMFIYGGPALRDHRQTFLGSNGFNRLICENDLPVRTFHTFLGYSDGDLFQSAHEVFESQPRDKPFFALLLTLSYHTPFKVPEFQAADAWDPDEPGQPSAAEARAIQYTDHAIGEFMRQARKSSYYDRTIFVFVADHPGGFTQRGEAMDEFQIPWLILGPREIIGDPRRITRVCSQMDVAPTLLGLLGGEYEHCFFGSDVFQRDPEADSAFILSGQEELFLIGPDGYGLEVPPHRRTDFPFRIDGRRLVFLDPGVMSADRRMRLRRRSIATIQVAARLFRTRKYHTGIEDAR